MLGAALLGLGRLDEAETLLLAGYNGLRESEGVNPSRITQALEGLVRLYERWDATPPGDDRHGEAARWRVELEAWMESHPE